MKNNAQAFVNQFVILALVTLFCGGSVGLGMVWMRHQISTVANRNRVLAADFERVQKLVREKSTEVETEQRPEILRQRNAEMHLGLVPLNDVPVVHVPDDVVRRLAERAQRLSAGELNPVITLPLARR
jgi:hypothetical protein